MWYWAARTETRATLLYTYCHCSKFHFSSRQKHWTFSILLCHSTVAYPDRKDHVKILQKKLKLWHWWKWFPPLSPSVTCPQRSLSKYLAWPSRISTGWLYGRGMSSRNRPDSFNRAWTSVKCCHTSREELINYGDFYTVSLPWLRTCSRSRRAINQVVATPALTRVIQRPVCTGTVLVCSRAGVICKQYRLGSGDAILCFSLLRKDWGRHVHTMRNQNK